MMAAGRLLNIVCIARILNFVGQVFLTSSFTNANSKYAKQVANLYVIHFLILSNSCLNYSNIFMGPIFGQGIIFVYFVPSIVAPILKPASPKTKPIIGEFASVVFALKLSPERL